METNRKKPRRPLNGSEPDEETSGALDWCRYFRRVCRFGRRFAWWNARRATGWKSGVPPHPGTEERIREDLARERVYAWVRELHQSTPSGSKESTDASKTEAMLVDSHHFAKVEWDVVALRAKLKITKDALRVIATPGCLVQHDRDGSWIDTERPAKIAREALDLVEEARS